MMTWDSQPSNHTFWPLSNHSVSPCMNERQNRCQGLNSLENWRRPPGRPHTTWIKTIQQDLKSNNLSLNEATDVAQNRLVCQSGDWCIHLALCTRSDACQKWWWCRVEVLNQSPSLELFSFSGRGYSISAKFLSDHKTQQAVYKDK